jgi:hypothetical protein
MTAVYVKNVSPTRALDRKLGGTPYEAWHGKQPDVKHLRVFGCLKRTKLDYKSKAHIFIGYSLTSKAYRLYDPITKKLVVSRDVIFREQARYSPSIQEEIDLQEHFMPVKTTPRKYYFDDDSESDAPVSPPTPSTHLETSLPKEQEVQVERHIPEITPKHQQMDAPQQSAATTQSTFSSIKYFYHS